MAVQELEFSVRPLRRSFESARRWLWLQRSLHALAASLCVAGAFALAAALLMLFRAPDTVVSWLWAAAAVTPAAGLLAALLVRPTELEAVRLVDQRLDLHQQLGTAHELLAKGPRSSLAPWQLALASDLAGGLPVSRAFPLLPKRELLVALLLAAATAGALALVNLGVVIPNPFESVRIPGITQEAALAPERQLFGDKQEGQDGRTKSPALETTRQMLNQIQRQAQRGALSQAAAANALQQANNELNRAAQESNVRQDALDKLSNELRSTAAGNEISQSLRQGDYERAAQQIRELGRQSEQLSAAAKQQLSQALNNSAAASQGLQQLSRAENRAAQSLQSPQSGETVYSMDRLAQAVEEAGRQIVPQSELAETWQQMDDLNRELANNQQDGSGETSSAPQAAQSPDGAGEKSSSMQQSGSPSEGDQANDGSLGLLGENGGQLPSGSGQPGNVPGSSPLGNPNSPQGVNGNPLELNGQVGDQFSNEPDSGSQAPSVMREGDATSSGTGQQGGGAASAPAENVFVPGDRRSIVRDYFSNSRGAGSQ